MYYAYCVDVGAVYQRFRDIKEESEMGMLPTMTESQLEFVESIRLLCHATPKKVASSCLVLPSHLFLP